ncbi:hypothetical protein CALVIDRAFT_559979 [Calocera viscosa TUFC12733]|uniref:Uncharacterized protein n=1 Tax=Calocera viscosa (strain TUFC12733) TaxID=1330018 RepID=A0A167RWZ2_CALVF|nr:hypothetical protein CALVIDRAFT_559979 [Calocera viscosa TUFC12733]
MSVYGYLGPVENEDDDGPGSESDQNGDHDRSPTRYSFEPLAYGQRNDDDGEQLFGSQASSRAASDITEAPFPRGSPPTTTDSHSAYYRTPVPPPPPRPPAIWIPIGDGWYAPIGGRPTDRRRPAPLSHLTDNFRFNTCSREMPTQAGPSNLRTTVRGPLPVYDTLDATISAPIELLWFDEMVHSYWFERRVPPGYDDEDQEENAAEDG